MINRHLIKVAIERERERLNLSMKSMPSDFSALMAYNRRHQSPSIF